MDNTISNPKIDGVVNTCVAVRLRLLNRVVSNLYDDVLRPLDLKISQMNILVVTAKLDLAQPAKVCDLLQLDTSTLSRNLERMRAKGWLATVPGKDARMQPFRLTPRGKKLLDKAMPAWEKAQEQARQLLGQDGVALLTKTISKLGMLHATV